jgi:hypothetical protein
VLHLYAPASVLLVLRVTQQVVDGGHDSSVTPVAGYPVPLAEFSDPLIAG